MNWPWSRKTPPPSRPRIHGVWSTLHTTAGDFDTDTVEDLVINGEMQTYYLRRNRCPFSCTIKTTTLHMGALVVELKMEPVTVRAGDGITVIQPVSWTAMVAENPIRRNYA